MVGDPRRFAVALLATLTLGVLYSICAFLLYTRGVTASRAASVAIIGSACAGVWIMATSASYSDPGLNGFGEVLHR